MSGRYTTPALIFLVGAPTGIFAHEFGHYLTAIRHGCDAQLLAAKTKYTGIFDDQAAADAAQLLIAMGGPAVQVILLLLGTVFVFFFVRRDMSRRNPNLTFWIASFGCFSGFRWFFTLFQGDSTDESSISKLIGYEWYVVPSAMFFVSVGAAFTLFWAHKNMLTLRPLGVAIVAGGVGAYAWINAVGPAILGG